MILILKFSKLRAIWKIRGLTGYELGLCNEASSRNKNVRAIIDGLASQIPSEIAQALKSFYGRDEVPQDVAKRIEQLILGSVEPKVDVELATKLCKAFPIEFYILTNKINELTGKGHIPGKVQPSGETQTSEHL